jgi:FixJ family two-component response regulator
LFPQPLIAILDDDDAVRTALDGLLRSLGFATCMFGSAEAFLRSPALDRAWCLVSDIRLPGISGLELQQRLIAERRNMPIIYITAFPGEVQRAQAHAAGAIAFLAKPFDAQTLLDALETALRSSLVRN